jgi:hypothetical protein
MHRIYDWSAIQRYHDEGHGFRACLKMFGCTHAAWRKAVRRGDIILRGNRFQDGRRRYHWSEIQSYYDEGHSFSSCKAQFGFSNAAWAKANERGELIVRPITMSLDELLSSSHRSRRHVKTRLMNAGLLQNKCDACGITEWLGRPLAMHLDHINGMKNDHRLQNLRMLCPNCHSQTDTYGGKNIVRRRCLQETPRML